MAEWPGRGRFVGSGWRSHSPLRSAAAGRLWPCGRSNPRLRLTGPNRPGLAMSMSVVCRDEGLSGGPSVPSLVCLAYAAGTLLLRLSLRVEVHVSQRRLGLQPGQQFLIWHTCPATHPSTGSIEMPASGSPTVRRRRLAAELRRLRASTGKTADEVGKLLGWSKAKVSRYELARGGLKPTDVARLLDLYGLEGSHREQLLVLAEEGTEKGWWDAYTDILTEGHSSFLGLEAEATSFLEWQINVVPGLLQTEQYAREILSGYHEVATISPKAIERRLETRLISQQLLTRDEPLELAALLDESVLHRRRGDRSLMYAQLQRLVDVSELPNVTIRILPFDRHHALAVDSFAILQFGQAHDTILHDVVSVEHLTNELYVEGDIDTYQFKLAFDHIAEESLSSHDSRDLILEIARRVWGKT
jgi:transcriptional regulator with XRE-family HTH domain